MKIISWVLCVCVFLRQCCISNARLPEAQLHDDLLSDINPYVRPVSDITKPVNVSVKLYLLSIMEINERERAMSSKVWLDLRWFDEQLVWNISKYAGINNTRLPFNRMWTPDVLLRNEVGNEKGLQHTNFVDPVVFFSGNVIWWPGKEVKTTCEVDTTKYPFDEQHCVLEIGKWYSSDSKITLKSELKKIETSFYEESEEWELIDTHVKFDTRLEGEYSFSRNLFVVKVKRRSAYFIVNIILPVLLMSILNQLCYVIPLESGEKIGMCMSIFLTFAVFLSLVGNSLPQSSIHLPAYCIYLVFQTILGILTISSEVLILRIYHNSCSGSFISKFAFFAAPALGLSPTKIRDQSKEDNEESNNKSEDVVEEVCRKLALQLDFVCGLAMFCCNFIFTLGFFLFVAI